MRVRVLGSAAGGGFPQWNCACPNCSRLRAGDLHLKARTQAGVMVCADAGESYLLNASPDLRNQILSTRLLAPAVSPRHTPIAGVFLTSADVDSVAGLLSLREFQPLHIYATKSVRRIVLEENRIFRVLERANPPACWHDVPVDTWFPLGTNASSGDTSVRCRGTFWDDTELISTGAGSKTAREIGHLPLSGAAGLLQEFHSQKRVRKILIHINNTNPILDEESPEHREVRDAGWEIAYDGMEFDL